MSAMCEIKHKVHEQDANKARGEAEGFINIKATRWVFYFAYSTSKAMLYLFYGIFKTNTSI